MDSITRIKDFISNNFPEWEKVDYSKYGEDIDFRKDWSELYKIDNEEVILISYANISITGTDRVKPQLRVFLEEYKKPFYFAKKYQLRFYLFSIFTKEDEMAKGLNNFNPKEYIISIETNLDNEDSRRDLRSIYDYANEKLNGKKFLKCTRANYKADINQASFIYIGTPEAPDKQTFESFINIFDSRPYINSRNEANNQLTKNNTPTLEENNYSTYLTAIRTKAFILLAGISGTGKSRIVRKLAQATDDIDVFVNDEDRWKCSRPANFELIQVKPNWHNSMDVVGFQSNIPEPHYEFTPFVDFVVKAWCHEDTPFFLCLDEMNLAPVEEYFAEFLSAIESRSIGENGEFETDPIIKPFDSFGKEQSGDMMNHFEDMGFDIPSDVEHRLRTKGLTLPKNLIVMGTVNMDETTFSFSRKVLDRAMSIEMNKVDYDGFIEGTTEYNIPKLTEQNSLFVNRPISAQEVKEGIESQTVMDFLKGVNDILEGTPFKLGYRAANEAILYVAADKVVGADNLKAALDDFTLMKILSRIEGDDSKLVTKDGDKLLEKLNDYFANVFDTKETSKSLAKLDNMIKTLKRDHFVSFWG